MYCSKCGKHNPEDSNFCKHCGVKIGEDNVSETIATKQVTTTTTIPSTQKKKHAWESIGGLAILAISYAVGKALGLVFFFLAVGFLVGYWFAKWFIKNHADSKFFSIVAWLNVISWLSPVLGFLTAGITYVFAQNKKQIKYNVLWIIALVLAIGNALLYPYVTGSNKTGLSDFKASYKSSFIDSCNKAAGSAESYCGCIADYMVHNYSEVQLTQITLQYKTSGQTPQELKDAATSCATNSNQRTNNGLPQ